MSIEVNFMRKMLITGGTVFVSRFAAAYFADKYEVYVLNRNTRPQCNGVTLIEGDRHALGDILRGFHFDVVIDTAYNDRDIHDLLDALDSYGDYLLISSSAVYPETEAQPFTEETPVGANSIWGSYGTDKIAAEKALQARVPDAYILRPPYLYGPGNNVYREAFVFDCAMADNIFCLPGTGEMKMQFFHVRDLFRFVEVLLEVKPQQRVFNVGNPNAVSIRGWAETCYQVAGKPFVCREILAEVDQRNYFPFYKYEYFLDVSKQMQLLGKVTSLEEGLQESLAWYRENSNVVRRKPLMEYIDKNFKETE